MNHSDIAGGAARAAYRIHHSLRDAGIDSRMWVNNALTDDLSVESLSGRLALRLVSVRRRAARWCVRQLRTNNPVIHSPAYLPSQWVKRINASDADVINLHWVQGEMLSIADIGRIQKPIVWTLHDMWAFCGAEHLAWDDRWRNGYHRVNRPTHESGFDLNRWTWQRKRKHWQQPMYIVTPSQWLANCVRESALMRDWPVAVVPNPIDTERWRPFDRSFARELLGLPADVPLLLFGSYGANYAHHKGFDLLLQAFDHLREDSGIKGMEVVVFGQRAPQSLPDLGCPIHYTGHLHDDVSLRALYSAADAITVPSRQEVFGQTASEAHACGTPVIAFRTGGLPDIVEHQRTGYLAAPFSTEDLAHGIAWVLAKRSTGELGNQARKRAEMRFAAPVVSGMYQEVYKKAQG